MKQGRGIRWGEGRLLTAVLCVFFVFSLGTVWSRRPRSETVAPAHAVLQRLEEPPLNLNTTTAEELMNLPGIGEELAARILEYRADNGPFIFVDELDAVPGIGEGKLEKIRDLVCVQ